jgi:hypothetical protein
MSIKIQTPKDDYFRQRQEMRSTESVEGFNFNMSTAGK